MTIRNTLTLIAVGALIGGAGVYLFTPQETPTESNSDEPTPLYWVAPMDPNFKRDKPGKSPMGMDLIPVYETTESESEAGGVSISAGMQQNLGVKTIVVERSVPNNTLRTFGTVQYDETAMVHVHPRISGWIESLYVSAQGDYIEKGAPLYSLYSPELVNAQEEYLLAIQQNNRNLIRAAESRLSALRVPQQTIEQVKNKRTVTSEITFYAPQTGYVDQLHVREGFYVDPNDTLLSLAGTDSVWVLVDILNRDAQRIERGQSVDVQTDAAPGKRYTSAIQQIYPDLDPTTRTLKARVTLENPDGVLKPNMLVDVAVDTHSHLHHVDATIALPQQAIIQTGNNNRVVKKIGDDQYQSVSIELGQQYDDEIEILSGVDVGDEIVVSAQFLIDSESNTSTDLNRQTPMEESPPAVPANSAWTSATVNAVDHQGGLVNLTHGPLDAFGMMGMTMNFGVVDGVNYHALENGMEVHVEIIKSDSGQYLINTLHIPEQSSHQHHHHGDHE